MITKKLMTQKVLKKKVVALPFFPFIFIFQIIMGMLKRPIYKRGIHAIINETGAGKTLTAHLLTKEFKNWKILTNKKFNSSVEVIDINDYFKNGKQIKELSHCILILDEIQHDFNRRNNKRKDYNDVFIPFVMWLQTHRHQKVFRVYLITQSFESFDTQLAALIHKVHYVKARQMPSLYEWLRTKKWYAGLRPTMIKIASYKKDWLVKSDTEKYINKNGEVKHRKPAKYSMKVRLEDLTDYNTYTFENIIKPKAKVDTTT